MQIVYSLIAFLIAIAILVSFHEFGHFWVARRLGVKVLRFSIGFGRPLITWHDKKGTEYVIAMIPLGGYVKMLDETEGEVAETEKHMDFKFIPRGLPREQTGDGVSKGEPRAPLWSPSARALPAQA